ncbi:MAG: GxxExxY protein [Candidatus Cloacimonetes bacterium]|nr:GxxExxY protein [Candidatus Cloacimonadota bacterium]MCF7813829.1 GxxExxY protein [Candidatus Cloacimonadota bacterium]MCF7868267.1 GxxExxY protein [Candidatus Cloacimonadota bacterium]MCF7883759.1 GxxExxY protein [Candidatus Cloacimonadota bacterium]
MLKQAGLSSDIIQCFYEVYYELGRGYLECVLTRSQDRLVFAFRLFKNEI